MQLRSCPIAKPPRETHNRHIRQREVQALPIQLCRRSPPAFHEQTDETSPAHAGFQEWGGMGERNAIQQAQEAAAGLAHAARESTATSEEKAASIAAARKVLQSVLPPDLYKQAITPPKQ